MEGITLLLDRAHEELWISTNVTIVSIWNVTGLEREKESCFKHVRILRKGRQIGGVWEVKEIKERW